MTFKTSKAFMTAVMAVTLFTAVPQAFADAAATQTTTQTQTSVSDHIISTGKAYLGTPYQYGAKKGDTSHFDCSSFIQYIFGQNGITLPRSSKQQSQVGTPVSRQDLQPGDLVFFYSPIHHVAVYIGNGKIMHTYGKPGVSIDDLNSGWWDKHYTSARRVINTATSSGASQAPKAAPAANTGSNVSKQNQTSYAGNDNGTNTGYTSATQPTSVPVQDLNSIFSSIGWYW